MATVPGLKLDHVILLISYSYMSALPSFLTEHFTVYPGGRHADGKTENMLIIFRSGVYIELIAFVDDNPKVREGHWWGNKEYGWIDWALTSDKVEDIDAVRNRLLKNGFPQQYEDAMAGGRTKPDGMKVEWRVTFPHAGIERGSMPFWCHDITPREWRVPVEDAVTQHSSGVVGIAEVRVVTREANVQRLASLYSAILAYDNVISEGLRSPPFTLRQPMASAMTATISIDAPRDSSEEALLAEGKHSAAIAEIIMKVDKDFALPQLPQEIIGNKRAAFGFSY